MNTELSVPEGTRTQVFQYRQKLNTIAQNLREKLDGSGLYRTELPRGYYADWYFPPAAHGQQMGLFRTRYRMGHEQNLCSTSNMDELKAFCEDLEGGLVDEINAAIKSLKTDMGSKMDFLNSLGV